MTTIELPRRDASSAPGRGVGVHPPTVPTDARRILMTMNENDVKIEVPPIVVGA